MRVVELFAGVGGFRLGFEDANLKLGHEYYKIVWSNHWSLLQKPNMRQLHIERIGILQKTIKKTITLTQKTMIFILMKTYQW